MASWCEISDDERLAWLTEMVVDLHVTNGLAVVEILREFSKIRQFAELGRRSILMRRAISRALSGNATDDLESYLRIVGLPDDSD
jgi:hypothetical protein